MFYITQIQIKMLFKKFSNFPKKREKKVKKLGFKKWQIPKNPEKWDEKQIGQKYNKMK